MNEIIHLFYFVTPNASFIQIKSVKMKKIIIIFLLICAFLHIANSYRILAVAAVPSKSHYYITHALMKALAEEGHDVTVISPFKAKKPIKNYKEVILENSLDLMRQGIAQFNLILLFLH